MKKTNTIQLIVSAKEAAKIGNAILSGDIMGGAYPLEDDSTKGVIKVSEGDLPKVRAILDAGTELDSGRK